MFEVKDSNDKSYGKYETGLDARDAIHEFIDETGFTTHYWRQIPLEDGRLWIDYGSHTHFFYIIPMKGEHHENR